VVAGRPLALLQTPGAGPVSRAGGRTWPAIERFAKQLARLGVPVAASTLGSLFHRCAELLTPLYDRLLALIAAQAVVQADEGTPR